MSWMGSMPKSTMTLESPTTSYDSHPASAVCLSLILSTRVRAMSSSEDRSCPLVGRRPCSCSSTKNASRNSRSISCLDLEPEVHS
jgi:hypothetical protein